MIKEFEPVAKGVLELISEWEPKFLSMSEEQITGNRNKQNRTIKEIVGHMIDSASNNTHRTIHMHYGENPLKFPNYASNGNNDRWIAIQNYMQEDWQDMINLWKYSNRHYVHLVKNIDASKLDNKWHYNEERLLTLKECVVDYLRHLKLHLSEIEELL